jgi:hypothetical protein
LLRLDLPKGYFPYVRVRMTDGAVWSGSVGEFTTDLDTAGRELVLGPPLYSATGGKKLTLLPPTWQRVVLRGESIETMTVKYELKAPRPDAAITGWRQRLRRWASDRLAAGLD